MKIALIFCFLLALAWLSSAQTTAPDSAKVPGAHKRPSRSELVSQMTARRAQMMTPAPAYKGPEAKAARRDARMFRLPKDLLLKLRAGGIGSTSDYFKPTAASIISRDSTRIDAILLADSAYVQTYRYYAFNSAQRQIINPGGTRLLIGGAALVAAALTVGLIVVLSHSKG